MYELYERLNRAYGCSTINNNLFEKEINKIKWDDKFHEDGEYYFVKEFKKNNKTVAFTLSTPSLNPFEMDWKPTVTFVGCGCMYELGL